MVIILSRPCRVMPGESEKDMNKNIEFLKRLLDSYESIEDKIYFLQLKERQKYHYYCDCGAYFTQEQDNEYHETWDWIIENLNRLKAEQAAG